MGGIPIPDMTGMIMDGLAVTFLVLGVLSVYASRSAGLHEESHAGNFGDFGFGIACLIVLIILAFAPSAWNAMKNGLHSSHYVPQN